MLVKNTLWLLSEKLIKLLGAVVISALIARHLQPDGFGTLNFYLAMLSIASVLSSLGLNRIVVREVASSHNKAETASLVKTALYLRLFASFLVFFIAVVSANLFVPQHQGYYSAIVFICLIFNASEILDLYQQGISRFKVVSQVRLIAFVISAAIKLTLVMFKVDLVWFLVANLVEYIVIALLIYKYCARYNSQSILAAGVFSPTKVKILVSESWPEIIAGFSAILFLKMDQIMLFYLSSEQQVGIYSAAARLSEAWYFIPMAIVAATFPRLVELKKTNMASYLKGIKFLLNFMVIFSIVVSLVVMFIGDKAIQIIFGDAFSDSSSVLVIHTWSSIFLCIGLVSGSWLVTEKRIKLNLYRNLVGLSVNFFLNMLLIPRYGAIGASWAMVFGLASAYLFFNLFNKDLNWIFFEVVKTPCVLLKREFTAFLWRQFRNAK
jgi:O-antigen/teichoic acid export membrane protein